MTAEELAQRHPQLFHITTPGAWDGIRKHGLLSAARLLDGSSEAASWADRIRPAEVVLDHPVFGQVVLNDNTPLHERKLAACLDDGLRPADWLRMLNARVFFWADDRAMKSLLNAQANRKRSREVLVFDTLSLVRANFDRVEICPFNSGSTLYDPVRRGRNTFAPLSQVDYVEWRRSRQMKSLDRIKEIVVRDHVLDIEKHLKEIRAL